MPRYIHSYSLAHGSDYIMPRYIQPHSLVPWEWLYHATIYPPPLSSSMGAIITCLSISTPLSSCMGITIMIIMPWLYTHSSQNLGLIIRTLYFHSQQNLMRGWIYCNVIFSFPTIFGGSHYIVTLYFHSWQYLVRVWLYRNIIFSPLTIFGRGVGWGVILWHHIFTPDNIGEGVIISWHYIFTPDTIWSGGDYTVTQYFHPMAIFGEGMIISWHNIFTPDNIWLGGDYIVTSYSHPWQYLVGVIISWHHIFTPGNIDEGWLYRNIISALLTIFGAGWLYRDIVFSLLRIFGEGVIILWHNSFTPGNIWWGDDYIVTLYFHSWQYLMRGWLYCDIIFSLLIIFGAGEIISWHISPPDDICWGVIISWHYIIIPDTTLESGTGGDHIWIFSLSKFDSAVIPGFYYSYPSIHHMKHDTLFAVETCFGGYVNGLYQQSVVINKNL